MRAAAKADAAALLKRKGARPLNEIEPGSPEDVAEAVGVTRVSVWHWRKRPGYVRAVWDAAAQSIVDSMNAENAAEKAKRDAPETADAASERRLRMRAQAVPFWVEAAVDGVVTVTIAPVLPDGRRGAPITASFTEPAALADFLFDHGQDFAGGRPPVNPKRR